MNEVTLKNRVNNEQVLCSNLRDVQFIDGVEYLKVRKPGQIREFLMRKEALIKVDKKTSRTYNK